LYQEIPVALALMARQRANAGQVEALLADLLFGKVSNNMVAQVIYLAHHICCSIHKFASVARQKRATDRRPSEDTDRQRMLTKKEDIHIVVKRLVVQKQLC
jgi:hypothetical protein